VFAAYETDNHLCKLERGTRLLQDGADEGSQNDDDADAAEDSTEAGTDDTRDFLQGQADDNGSISRWPGS